MMPLFKRMMSGDRQQEYFHSSGYAQAQNGSGMGAVSAQSFQERKAIEDRRKFVQGYRNARLVGEGFLRERIKSQASNIVEGDRERGRGVVKATDSSHRQDGARTTGLNAKKPSERRAGSAGAMGGVSATNSGASSGGGTGSRGVFQYRPDFGRKS